MAVISSGTEDDYGSAIAFALMIGIGMAVYIGFIILVFYIIKKRR